MTRDCLRFEGAVASVEVPTALAPGVWFWQRSLAGASTNGPWWFTVPARTGAVSTSWGTTLDLNGDGFADLAAAVKVPSEGDAVLVFLGGPSGLGATPVAKLTNGAVDRGSVVSAGDVNGDGFGDLAIGEPGSGDTGRVVIFHGSADGPRMPPETTLVGPRPTDRHYATSIAPLGDINGDGYDDLAVAPFVYLGSAHGLSTTAALDLADAGSNGYYDGGFSGRNDIDGDGYGDFTLATRYYDRHRVLVFHGRAGGPSTTDVEVIKDPHLGALSAFFGTDSWFAGDLDGDGFGEFAVSAVGTDVGRQRIYLYDGGPGGATSLVAALSSPNLQHSLAALWSLGDLNGDGFTDVGISTSVRVIEPGPFYIFGGSASGVAPTPSTGLAGYLEAFLGSGDINGDGYSDFVLRALSLGRRAVVFLGGPNGLEPPPSASIFLY